MNINEIREQMGDIAADSAQVSYRSRAQYALLLGIHAIQHLQAQVAMLQADIRASELEACRKEHQP